MMISSYNLVEGIRLFPSFKLAEISVFPVNQINNFTTHLLISVTSMNMLTQLEQQHENSMKKQEG